MPAEYLWYALAAVLFGGLAGFLLGHLRSVRAATEAAAARSRADEYERQVRYLDEERRKLVEQLQVFTADLATEKQKTSGLEESRASLKAEIEKVH